MTFEDLRISPYQASLPRECARCRRHYTIGDHEPSEWGGTLKYREDCDQWCLGCWLDAWPEDSPDPSDEPDLAIFDAAPMEIQKRALASINDLKIGHGWEEWPRNHGGGPTYAAQCAGRLLQAYTHFTERGIPLVVMPLTQAMADRPVHYPNGITYYPPGGASFDGMDHIEDLADSVAQRAALNAGATLENLTRHGLLVLPAKLDAELIASASHDVHIELIRRLSEEVDKVCLNFVRYHSCTLDRSHAIPARAGQTEFDPAMSLCLVFDPVTKTSRMYGGGAFCFSFTGSIGIGLRQPEWQTFPAHGEVGKIALHALTLYRAALETSSETLRFIQALSLLEFLAFPNSDEYRDFKKVKDVIARYVAKDQVRYDRVKERLYELTGKKDPDNKKRTVGVRTRVVHFGERLEAMIPRAEDRRALFAELDGYIRPIIRHMIEYSEIDLDAYMELRETLPDFGTHLGPRGSQ